MFNIMSEDGQFNQRILANEIDKFIAMNDGEKPELLLSKDTAKLIPEISMFIEQSNFQDGYLGEMRGTNMLVTEEIPFGFVKLN